VQGTRSGSHTEFAFLDRSECDPRKAWGIAADGSAVYAAGISNADVFVRRYDPDGKLVRHRQIGSTEIDRAFGVARPFRNLRNSLGGQCPAGINALWDQGRFSSQIRHEWRSHLKSQLGAAAGYGVTAVPGMSTFPGIATGGFARGGGLGEQDEFVPVGTPSTGCLKNGVHSRRGDPVQWI
jgi:hypothetical protein